MQNIFVPFIHYEKFSCLSSVPTYLPKFDCLNNYIDIALGAIICIIKKGFDVEKCFSCILLHII